MIKYLTQEEERRLSRAIKGRYAKRDRFILTLAVNTGLRVSELCGLTVSDVMNSKIKDELVVRREIAKGKVERVIPLNRKVKRAIKELISWNKDQGFNQYPISRLLISQKGKAMTRQQVQRIIKRARERARLDLEATPHTLRHTLQPEY